MDPICIAGAGRVGQALGRLLRLAGEPVVAIASRTFSQAERAAAFVGGEARAASYEETEGRVLICAPDDAVADVASRVGSRTRIALHTCGSRGPEILLRLRERGVAVGSLHPLQTFPTPDAGVERLPGCAFAVAGDPEAAEWAAAIVALLGGTTLTIQNHALYHAAAVMASNYVVALLGAAESLMEMAGVRRDDALPALAPLIRASVENTIALGPARALTGPLQRGDAGTIALHMEALREAPERVRELYRSAGLQTLTIPRRGEGISEIERILQERN